MRYLMVAGTKPGRARSEEYTRIRRPAQRFDLSHYASIEAVDKTRPIPPVRIIRGPWTEATRLMFWRREHVANGELLYRFSIALRSPIRILFALQPGRTRFELHLVGVEVTYGLGLRRRTRRWCWR